MKHPAIHSMITSFHKAEFTSDTIEEYAELVNIYAPDLIIDDHYLYVGKPRQSQGWIVHITVIPFQIQDLLTDLLPELTSIFHVPFKIIRSKELHEEINAGLHGDFLVGKVITIYLDNDQVMVPLVSKLMELTERFTGPHVVTDFRISKNLFTRYGSFEPHVETDAFGNRIRMIKDLNGNLIEDSYNIPPIIPYGVSVPFLSLISKRPKPPKLAIILNKYLLIHLLKEDIKGNVWKGIYFNKYFIPKWCIVKEGRKGIYPDKIGRDRRDWLAWQNQVKGSFPSKFPTPVIIDFFEEADRSLLVTQYIKKTKNLNHHVTIKTKHNAWYTLPKKIQERLIDYLIQILLIIQIVHEKGYVYRDITGTNFIINRKHQVKLIDLELIYSFKNNVPNPPFGVGTTGYMSAEQEAGYIPTIPDDIYAIGAVLVLLFTGGLEPAYIIDRNMQGLEERLLFLIGDKKISDLIKACLSTEPSNRPGLNYIINEISSLKDFKKNNSTKGIYLQKPDPGLIQNIIQQGITTLSGEFMAYNGVWYSRVENNHGWDTYPLGDKHFYSGIHQGVSGILYSLIVLKQTGFNIAKAEDNMNRGLEFVLTDIRDRFHQMAPSLYYGKAGIGLILSELVLSGMLEDNQNYKTFIKQLLDQQADVFDVMYGIAGQGLAALHCTKYLCNGELHSILNAYADNLIKNQNHDGSWNKSVNNSEDKEIVTGFGYGMAGILYFLTEYTFRYHNHKCISSIEKGTHYLIKKIKKKKTHYEWPISDKNKGVGNWWCTGGPGIALLFLRLFEYTKEKKYLNIAEKVLRVHPEHFVYYKLGQCHGLSGLGELYLEAFRVSGNEEWSDRATWIVNLLIQLRKQPSAETVYWLAEKHILPTADFMTGTSGIIHFLAHYSFPEKIKFPFLG